MRHFSRRTLGVTLTAVVVVSFFIRQAVADASLSALPSVGASQVFTATEQYTMNGMSIPPGPMPTLRGGGQAPHDQSGTLTVTRAVADSVHIAASDGLDTFDQTLQVDTQGSIAPPKPQYTFVELLSNVVAVLAAAPAPLQKNATWSVKLASPSWMSSGRSALPSQLSSVPATFKVISVTGNSVSVHGDGKFEQDAQTIRGTATSGWSASVDCTFTSGRIHMCSKTTTLGGGMPGTQLNLSDTVTLTAK